MLIFINNIEVTMEQLKCKLKEVELKEGKILELVEIDKEGNFYFDESVYGIYE